MRKSTDREAGEESEISERDLQKIRERIHDYHPLRPIAASEPNKQPFKFVLEDSDDVADTQTTEKEKNLREKSKEGKTKKKGTIRRTTSLSNKRKMLKKKSSEQKKETKGGVNESKTKDAKKPTETENNISKGNNSKEDLRAKKQRSSSNESSGDAENNKNGEELGENRSAGKDDSGSGDDLTTKSGAPKLREKARIMQLLSEKKQSPKERIFGLLEKASDNGDNQKPKLASRKSGDNKKFHKGDKAADVGESKGAQKSKLASRWSGEKTREKTADAIHESGNPIVKLRSREHLREKPENNSEKEKREGALEAGSGQKSNSKNETGDEGEGTSTSSGVLIESTESPLSYSKYISQDFDSKPHPESNSKTPTFKARNAMWKSLSSPRGASVDPQGLSLKDVEYSYPFYVPGNVKSRPQPRTVSALPVTRAVSSPPVHNTLSVTPPPTKSWKKKMGIRKSRDKKPKKKYTPKEDSDKTSPTTTKKYHTQKEGHMDTNMLFGNSTRKRNQQKIADNFYWGSDDDEDDQEAGRAHTYRSIDVSSALSNPKHSPLRRVLSMDSGSLIASVAHADIWEEERTKDDEKIKEQTRKLKKIPRRIVASTYNPRKKKLSTDEISRGKASTSPFLKLSTDVRAKIFTLLTPRGVGRLREVSKEFFPVSHPCLRDDGFLWKTVHSEHFGTYKTAATWKESCQLIVVSLKALFINTDLLKTCNMYERVQDFQDDNGQSLFDGFCPKIPKDAFKVLQWLTSNTFLDKIISNILLSSHMSQSKFKRCMAKLFQNAIVNESIDTVTMMLKCRYNLNNKYLRTGYGQTPICLACEIGNSGLVSLLIQHGAGVNDRGGQDLQTSKNDTKEEEINGKKLGNNTPLYKLLVNRNKSVAKVRRTLEILIKNGADVDVVFKLPLRVVKPDFDSSQFYDNLNFFYSSEFSLDEPVVTTPLHLAVDYDTKRETVSFDGKTEKVKLIELLTESGLDINSLDSLGETILFSAVECANLALMKILILMDAGVNIKSKMGETPLNKAILVPSPSDSLLAMELLLKHGANVDIALDDDKSFLSYVLKSGDRIIDKMKLLVAANISLQPYPFVEMLPWCENETVVQFLLELFFSKKMDVNKAIYDGKTPLIGAVIAENVHMMNILISRGADVNKTITGCSQPEIEGFTPLHLVAKNGKDNGLLQILLFHKANVHVSTKWGCTPLHLAVMFGTETIVKTLVDHNADVNASFSLTLTGYLCKIYGSVIRGETALHRSCYRSKTEIMRKLLDSKVIVLDAKDINGRTPLFLAIEGGREEMVRILISYGSNVNTMSNKGQTPLGAAVKRGDLQIVTVLIESGANVNPPVTEFLSENPPLLLSAAMQAESLRHVSKKDMYSAFNISKRRNENEEIVKLLIRNHADIDAKSYDGKTALDYCEEHFECDPIKAILLVAKELDLDSQTNPPNYPSKRKRKDSKAVDFKAKDKREIFNTSLNFGLPKGRNASQAPVATEAKKAKKNTKEKKAPSGRKRINSLDTKTPAQQDEKNQNKLKILSQLPPFKARPELSPNNAKHRRSLFKRSSTGKKKDKNSKDKLARVRMPTLAELDDSWRSVSYFSVKKAEEEKPSTSATEERNFLGMKRTNTPTKLKLKRSLSDPNIFNSRIYLQNNLQHKGLGTLKEISKSTKEQFTSHSDITSYSSTTTSSSGCTFLDPASKTQPLPSKGSGKSSEEQEMPDDNFYSGIDMQEPVPERPTPPSLLSISERDVTQPDTEISGGEESRGEPVDSMYIPVKTVETQTPSSGSSFLYDIIDDYAPKKNHKIKKKLTNFHKKTQKYHKNNTETPTIKEGKKVLDKSIEIVKNSPTVKPYGKKKRAIHGSDTAKQKHKPQITNDDNNYEPENTHNIFPVPTQQSLDCDDFFPVVSTPEYKSKFEKPKQKDNEKTNIPISNSEWNTTFQSCLEQENSYEKFETLGCLAHDFQHAAELYGRMIISERFLDEEEKRFPPSQLGGVAGGEKIIVRGILFKFAVDTKIKTTKNWMYGKYYRNDAFAMSAAGHELRSLERIVESGGGFAEEVFVPLMTLIDYRGFRLIAMSLVPIGKHTICYGSCDAGKSMHADPVMAKKCAKIFSRMNLKKHIVKDKVMHTCGDIEGHHGTDGKYYLVDFSRVYPPEAPDVVAEHFPSVDIQSVFFKMLRPELVGCNRDPLSSDAFTRWGANDPDFHQHNIEVATATRLLIEKIIPHVAENLLEHTPKHVFLNRLRIGVETVEGLNIKLTSAVKVLHAWGINMRYLGLIRRSLPSTDSLYHSLILTEMAARVCKNIIRALMRVKMRDLRAESEEPYRQLVLHLFNIFTGYSQHSTQKQDMFWESKEPIPFFYHLKNDKRSQFESASKTIPAYCQWIQGGAEYYIHKLYKKRKINLVKYSGNRMRSCTGKHENNYQDYRNLIMKGGGGLDIPYFKTCIIAKFGECALTPEEFNCNLREKIFLGVFFRRLCAMLNIILESPLHIFQALDQPLFNNNPNSNRFGFMDPHLKTLEVRAKHMHLIDSSEGLSLWIRAKTMQEESEERGDYDHKALVPLVELAKMKLESALNRICDSIATWINLIRVQLWLIQYGGKETTVNLNTLRQYLIHCENLLQSREGLGKNKKVDAEIENEFKALKLEVENTNPPKNRLRGTSDVSPNTSNLTRSLSVIAKKASSSSDDLLRKSSGSVISSYSNSTLI